MKQKKGLMSSHDTQNLVKCPYIPEHVMSIDSLMTHLNRCKATNKHLYKSCMYNCLHVIPKEKYDEHVQSCTDKFKHENDESVGREDDEESWEESFMRTNQNTPSKKSSKYSSDSSPNGWAYDCSSNWGSQNFRYDQYQQSSLYDKQKLMFYRPGYYYKNQQRPSPSMPRVESKYPPPPQFINDEQPFNNPRDIVKKPVKKLNQTIPNRETQNNRQKNEVIFPKSQKPGSEQWKKMSMLNQQQLSDKDTQSQSSKDNKKSSSSSEPDLLTIMKQLETSMRIDSLNESKDQFGDLLAMETSMLKKQRVIKNDQVEKKKPAESSNWSFLSEL